LNVIVRQKLCVIVMWPVLKLTTVSNQSHVTVRAALPELPKIVYEHAGANGSGAELVYLLLAALINHDVFVDPPTVEIKSVVTSLIVCVVQVTVAMLASVIVVDVLGKSDAVWELAPDDVIVAAVAKVGSAVRLRTAAAASNAFLIWSPSIQ
jgi:hypothetical protein